MSLVEKFQTIVRPNRGGKDSPDKMVSFQSQRVTTGNTMPDISNKFNRMPVGYEAETASDKFVRGFGGDTDVSGNDVNAAALGGIGFTRDNLKPDDEMYAGEQVEQFYGEVVGDDGNVGFCERNNYLDRI